MCKKLEIGRSMIEMLGVLAIVGVLSVGGIAGYSKAMEKYKINKVIGEYTSLIFSISEHLDDIKKTVPNGGYVNVLQSLNILPTSWQYQSNSFVKDSLNNNIQMWKTDSDSLYFEIYLTDFDNVKGADALTANKMQLCRELLINFAKPLADFFQYAYVWRNSPQTANVMWYGKDYCHEGEKCLRDITLSEINAACQSCSDRKGGCSIAIAY